MTMSIGVGMGPLIGIQEFWTPIPRLRGLILGSDAFLVQLRLFCAD
jgi:hypothetical protein